MALTQQVAGRLEGEARQLSVMGDTVVAALAHGPDFNEDQLKKLQTDLLNDNTRIHGITLAYKVDKGPNKSGHYCLYRFRTDKGIVEKQLLPEKGYNYPDWVWFEDTMKGKSHWTGPSFDTTSKVWMVGYSVSMWRGDKKNLVGVLCIDLELAYFNQVWDWLAKLNLGKGSYGFVVNGKGSIAGIRQDTEGVFICHPTYGAGKGANEAPKKITELTEDPDFTKLTERILNRETGQGTATDPATRKQSTFLFTPVSNTGWVFVAVIEN
jgi:hypothetical protein